MTAPQALALVREIRALERLAFSITGHPVEADEWRYALTALDDRLRWLRYVLSLEDPGLVAAVDEIEADERRVGRPGTVPPDPRMDATLPSGRIH
jgi:hypothetical protein